jgi:hypothetical protein
MKRFAQYFLSVCIFAQSFIGCASMADRSVNKDVKDFQSDSSENTYRQDSEIDLRSCFRISKLQDEYETNLVGIGGVIQMSSIGLMGGVASGNLGVAVAVISVGPAYFGWQISKSNSAKRIFLALRCDEIPLEDLTSASFISE